MGLVLNVCDYIYVLDFGRIIAEGTPAQIAPNPAVIAAYLGESAGEAQAQEGRPGGVVTTPTCRRSRRSIDRDDERRRRQTDDDTR